MSWFVRNLRDVQWYDAGRFGLFGDFEQGERFPEFGFGRGLRAVSEVEPIPFREKFLPGTS